jgi:hypothetical protein
MTDAVPVPNGPGFTRRLGVAEEALDLLERRRGAGHIVRIVALEDVPIVPETLARALGSMRERHPILGAGIVESEDGLRFAPTEVGRDPVRLVPRVDDDSWRAVADAELNAPFQRGGPLIRTHVVTGADSARSEVVVAGHHAIVDGEAMTRFSREVLLTYHGLLTGSPVELPPATGADEPAETALGDLTASPSFRDGPLHDFVLRQIALKEAGPLTTFPQASSGGTTSRSVLLHHVVPRSVADALRSRSRAEGASVHAALGAALVLGARRELLDGGAGAFALVSATSLRRRLPARWRDAIGLYSSGVRTRHDVRPATTFWELAREIRQDVARALDRDEDVCALMLQREAMDHYLSNQEAGFAWLSDPGELDLPAGVAGGRVRASHGAVPIHGFGPVVHAHASTFGDQLTWNFVYPDPVVDRATVESLAIAAVARLEGAAGR